MVPKALSLTLLSALQKRQDAACSDYCPFGTMTIGLAPTETVLQQPIRISGYFPTNGPITLAPNVVATVTGAPGVIDTVVTIATNNATTNTITICPGSQSTGGPSNTATGSSTETTSSTNTGSSTETTVTSTSTSGSSSGTDTGSSSTTDNATTTDTSSSSATTTDTGSSSATATDTGSSSVTDTTTTTETGSLITTETGSSTTTETGSSITTETGSSITTKTGSSITTKTGSLTATDTESLTATETGSLTTTDTGSLTATKTGSSTTTDTGSSTTTDTGSSTTTDTGSSTTTDTGSSTATDTGSSTTTDTGSSTTTDTESLTATKTGSSTTTDTGSLTTTDTRSSTTTDTGSSTATDTGSSTTTDTESSTDTATTTDTTTTTSTTSCITALPTVCATTLPQACQVFGTVSGLALVPLVPLCTTAIGAFATVGDIATCLSASISLDTSGADLVACLNAAAPEICISQLPSACLAIGTDAITQVPQHVVACTAALGPFAVGAALNCLQQTIQDPLSILSCLRLSIGLGDPAQQICTSATASSTMMTTPASTATDTSSSSSDTSSSAEATSTTETSSTETSSTETNTSTSTTTSSSCVPTTQAPVCAAGLPAPCAALSSANGLTLVPLVPLCAATLASLGTTQTAACLATTIALTTVGADIVTCLNQAITSVCITSLPQACLDIPTAPAVNLPGDVAACTTALGPFAVNAAATCLTTAVTDPLNVLSCLRTAIGLGDGSGGCSTSSINTTPVSTVTTTSATTSSDTSSATDSTSSVAPDATSASTDTTSSTTSSDTSSTTPSETSPTTDSTSSTTSSETSSSTDTTSSATSTDTSSSTATTTTTTTTTTTITTSSTSCIPTPTGPAPSACVTAVPAACAAIGSLNGLAIVPALAGCTLALGPFAVGNTATCLGTSAISFTAKGSDVVNCVLNSLKSRCITTLPAACTKLPTESGLALIPDVALCVTALGPFAVGTALTCLATSSITSSTSGTGIVTCLQTALGLQAPTPTSGAAFCTPTSTTAPSCPVKLRSACQQLGTTNGLALLVQIPLCVTALGVFGVGNAAQCLATTDISISTTGSNVLNCLTTALQAQCPRALPSACSNLATDNAAQAVVDIPLCTVALGPYAVGDALLCLSTSGLTGTQIFSCLNNALGIIV
ncbi:hypothetical protein MY1884_008428 [Beauveria asiatica]